MRILLCLTLVSSFSVVAQEPPRQVYLRLPNTGYCTVTNATNTTPIRMTVAGSCGLANGATILVTYVRGNTAANIHVETPDDNANLARKVANLSNNGRNFDLLDLNGNPVAGNGNFVAGNGRVGLAAPFTRRADPVIFYDGADGPHTTRLMSSTGDGLWQNSNPVKNALVTVTNNDAAQYNGGFGWDHTRAWVGASAVNAAIRCLAEPTATAVCGKALWSLRNIDQIIGTPACLPEHFTDVTVTSSGCGTAISSLADYPSQFGMGYYQAYSLLRDQLTPEERNNFLGFILSDLEWTKFGIGYTGTNKLKMPWRTRLFDATDPTVTASAGSRTLIGKNTHFTTQTVAGDVIIVGNYPGAVFADVFLVESIQSDTQLTLNYPSRYNMVNTSWATAPRWDPSYYGFLWHQKHQWMTPLTGLPPQTTAPNPYYGDLVGLYADPDGNLSTVRVQGYLALGIATCVDDLRGCLLASLSHEWMVDEALPWALQLWTGFSTSGTTYHQARMTGPLMETDLWVRNSFENGPQMFTGTTVREDVTRYLYSAYIPKINVFLTSLESSLHGSESCDRWGGSLVASNLLGQDNPYTQRLYWFLQTYFNPPNSFTACLANGAGFYTWHNYLNYFPEVTPVPPPETTEFFTANNSAACASRFGNSPALYMAGPACQAPDIKRMAISKSDWTPTATMAVLNAVGPGCRDHCAGDVGGYIHLYKNGKALLGGDSAAYMGARENRPYVEIGGSTALMQTGVSGKSPETFHGVPVPWKDGGNTYMFARAVLNDTYLPSARVTSIERQLFHLKDEGQDYVVDHVAATLSTPNLIRGLQHYHLNDCGTPSNTPCASLDRATFTGSNFQAGARLRSKAFGVGHGILINTENNSNTDGSYPGGVGKTFRWYVCRSSNGTSCESAASAEWYVVHQPSSASTSAMPELVPTISGAFRIIEIRDPAHPKVLAFTAHGVTSSTLTLNTGHAGTARYVITGVAAGDWVIRRAPGTTVAGPFHVVTGSHTLSFESTSGVLTLEPGPPPLTIATETLPDAVAGKPYLASIEAVSATQPYQWEIVSGSLCEGLTFNAGTPAATLTGSAIVLGSCTFTVKASSADNTQSATRQYTIAVLEPGAVTLALTTQQLPVGRAGNAYSVQLQSAGGTPPYRYSIAAGALCPGLTLSATGLIAGTAMDEQLCQFTVRSTDLGNDFVERPYFVLMNANTQTTLRLLTEVSHAAAVLRFGRLGLAFDQPCTVELRMGSSTGPVWGSFASGAGPARREIVATGLPAQQPMYSSVNCGTDTASADFQTGRVPTEPREVVFWLRPPELPGTVADVQLSYGGTPAMANAVISPCTTAECRAVITSSDPLIYWRARYRDAAGRVLADTGVRHKAPQ